MNKKQKHSHYYRAVSDSIPDGDEHIVEVVWSKPSAVSLIAAERMRQVTQEEWDESHDNNHIFGELARAAACYTLPPEIGTRTEHWHWDWSWWKPCEKDRIRELVKAGALIVAEIERLQRLQDE